MQDSSYLLFLLSFGHMCNDIVQGAIPALLPFLKDRYALSYTATGSLLLAAHLTSSAIQPLFGYFTDRRPFPFLLPLAPGFRWAIAAIMFTGLGTAAYHPEGFKSTACIVTERRATGMSLFSVGGNLRFTIGAPAPIFLVSRPGRPGAAALLVPGARAAALFLPAL